MLWNVSSLRVSENVEEDTKGKVFACLQNLEITFFILKEQKQMIIEMLEALGQSFCRNVPARWVSPAENFPKAAPSQKLPLKN